MYSLFGTFAQVSNVAHEPLDKKRDTLHIFQG